MNGPSVDLVGYMVVGSAPVPGEVFYDCEEPTEKKTPEAKKEPELKAGTLTFSQTKAWTVLRGEALEDVLTKALALGEPVVNADGSKTRRVKADVAFVFYTKAQSQQETCNIRNRCRTSTT
jgi:hypothetical protein